LLEAPTPERGVPSERRPVAHGSERAEAVPRSVAAARTGRPNRRMNPVASAWSYLDAPKLARSSRYRDTGLQRPATRALPLNNFRRTVPVTGAMRVSVNEEIASRSGVHQRPS